MTLFSLINRESPVSVKRLVTMAALSGLANAMVLAVINSASGVGKESFTSFRYVLLFSITVTVYIRAQSFLMVRSAVVVETILHGMRLRFIDLIRRADALPLEQIGRSSIYSAISGELVAISQATTEIVTASQAALMVTFAIAYLSVLSLWAFFITLIVAGVGVSIHLGKSRQREADMHEGVRRENGFLDRFTEMLDGFNEVKLNRRVAEGLMRDLTTSSDALRTIKLRVSHQFSGHFIFSQSIFYFLLACIVFLLPRLNEHDPMLLTKATSTILFIIGPLTSIMAAIPTFTMANVAVANIHDLEKRLASAMEATTAPGTPTPLTAFETIRLDQIAFHYTDQCGLPAFGVGPINLEIKAGETVFIVGGNGSGKSTFLRLLTSLYYAKSGTIQLDGAPLTSRNLQDYRSLFSIIFTDYHLFAELYGEKQPDRDLVGALLQRFELDSKVVLEGNRWSTTSLSTGQRKRLALIVALLHQKSIIVLDEWAADQDPGFRKYFYEVLIPELKAAGRTIIAATHDDRYFYLADRVLRMEYGQLEPWDGALLMPKADDIALL